MKFTLICKTIFYPELISFIQPTVRLAGKTLALSFKPSTAADEAIISSYLPKADANGQIDPNQLPKNLPGYLINLTAELTANGTTLAQAPAGAMGDELYEELGLWSPRDQWESSINHPTAGEYRAIGLDLQGANPEQAARLKAHLEQTKGKLESQNQTQLASLTKHELVGDLLYGTIFNYFALNDLQDKIAAQSSNIITYRLPSYGIFSTSLKTQYWFGIPKSVEFGGLSMDVDHIKVQRIAKTNNNEEAIAFTQSIGSRMSAMEHLVPEQMFSTEANKAQGISAVKALAIASQQGQKIWTIDKTNLDLALSKITLDQDAKLDIRNAVNAGKVVTAHEAQINFNGWIGEGYVVLDKETGAGAYIIAGGGNGSWIDSDKNLGSASAAFGLLGLLGVVAATSTGLLPLAPIVLVPIISIFIAFAAIGMIAYLMDGGTLDLCAGFKAMLIAFGLFATGGAVWGLVVQGLNSVMKGYIWFGTTAAGAACTFL